MGPGESFAHSILIITNTGKCKWKTRRGRGGGRELIAGGCGNRTKGCDHA